MKNIIKAIILATILMSLSQFVSAAAPANDHWQNAELISGEFGEVFRNSHEATTQTCEPTHQFPDVGSMAPVSTVWFKWVAPATASYTFRSVNSNQYRQSISAYVMAPGVCGGVPTSIPYRIHENRYILSPQGELASQISMKVTAGTLLYISLDSFLAGGGNNYQLRWSRTRYRYTGAQFDQTNANADPVISRNGPNGKEWWMARSTNSLGYNSHSAMLFGKTTDKPIVGDYNGDTITDIAIARPESGNLMWWITDVSGNLIKVLPFGLPGDKPIAADFDGDGICDIAVTRNEGSGQKTWHILRSGDGSYYSFQFGLGNDREIMGDFDADAKADRAVMRRVGNDYTWYIQTSAFGTLRIANFGQVGDIPQSADMDGDGVSDMVLFRFDGSIGGDPAGTWKWKAGMYVNPDQAPVHYDHFGSQGDFPQIGDYDGDGTPDLTIFRGGTWWLKRSTFDDVTTVNFGAANDAPMTDLGATYRFIFAP